MVTIWNEDITKHTDWGGDESTGGEPVSGEKVQKFIKDTLQEKAGCFYHDTVQNNYLIFADEEDRDTYLEDPEHHEDLLKFTIELDPMYYMRIYSTTPQYNPVFFGDKGNYVRYTFETETKEGGTFGESVSATYTIQCGSSVVTVNESYSLGTSVAFNVDKYLLEGTNNVTVVIKGETTGVSTIWQWVFEVVSLSISDAFDLTNVYHNGDNMTIGYRVTGNLSKRVEWWIDGTKYGEDNIGYAETATKIIPLSGYGAGRHNLQYRAYVDISGTKFYSNTLFRDFVIDDNTLDHIVILTKMVVPASTPGITPGIIDAFTEPIPLHGPVQYEEYEINYAVYSKSGTNLPPMTITFDGSELSYDVQTGYMYSYVIRSLYEKPDGVSLVFDIDDEDLVFNAFVEKSYYDLEPPAGVIFEFNGSDKTNDSENPGSWSYGNYTGTLEGFDWIESSGWNNGRLIMPAGTSFETNYKPLMNNPEDNGFTFEIEFKTSRVTDENATIIDLTSQNGNGLLITASEIKFSSQGGEIVSTKYKPEENIRVSIVVNSKSSATALYPRLMFIYIDGVLSGAVQYNLGETFAVNKSLAVEGSDSAVVFLKQIICYNNALSPTQILKNYILYRDSVGDLVEAYDRNDIYEENSSRVSADKLAARTPIIIITCNEDGDTTADRIAMMNSWDSENKGTYVKMHKIEIINQQDPTKNMTLINPSMRCQGTSSMAYPRKNFRFYTQADKKDETVDPYVTQMFDWEGHEITGDQRLYAFKNNAQPVKCWCLKADYAESSSTHNTGVARLWNDVMKNMRISNSDIDERFYLKDIFTDSSFNTPCRTIAQQLAEDNEFNYDVRTTVDGYPISLFYHVYESDPLIFLGRYNWNNDKSTESVFGFKGIPGFAPYKDTMECWEVVNGDKVCNLFTDLTNWNNGKGMTGGWYDSFEARYPNDHDEESERIRATKEGSALKRVATWINSTMGASKVDDDPDSPTYNKMIVDDSSLMTRFKTGDPNEDVGEGRNGKWDFLDVYKVAAYYIYLMRFGAVDQTVKNAMFTTEDGKHWYYINYDNDTINGVKNDGSLKFGYTIDRQSRDPEEPSVYCYAGHDSVLWNNLEADDEFMEIVRIVDNALYNIGGTVGLSYANVINMFNVKQSAQWSEATHNEDYKFKYLDGINTSQLPKLQGPRKGHRQWWLSNRFAIYDALDGTDAYISNKFSIKPAGTATPAPGDCVVVTPAVDGQIFGFGYQHPAELGVVGYKDVPITFNMSEDFYVGTTIDFYNAVYFKEIDLSKISKYINEIHLDKINTTAFDSNLSSLILGTQNSDINTALTSLSEENLAYMKYLEKFQMIRYNGISSLNLSNNKYLKEVYLNDCDNLSIIALPTAAPLTTVAYPAYVQTLDLHDLVSLTNFSIQWGGIYLKNIIINNCPHLTNDPTFILNWIENKVSDDDECTLNLDNVAWDNMSNNDLKTITNFIKNSRNYNPNDPTSAGLRGYASLQSLSNIEEVMLYLEVFGDNVFSPDATFRIIAPPAVFILGDDEILEGESAEYEAKAVGDQITEITYVLNTISPTHGDQVTQTPGSLNCELTTVETGAATQTISIACLYTLASGTSNSYFKDVSVVQRTYPTASQVTVTGPTEIKLSTPENPHPNVFSVEYPEGITGNMSGEWIVTGELADYVTVVNDDIYGCELTLDPLNLPPAGAAGGSISLTLTRVAQTAPAWSISTSPKTIGYQDSTIAISRAINPYAMDVVYNAGLCADQDKMTKTEAAMVLDTNIVSGNYSIFSNNSNFRNYCANFDEFQYFVSLQTIVNNCFNGCTKLESIKLPNNIRGIGQNAFSGCSKLTEINIPNNVTTIEQGAFNGCSKLAEINLSDNLTTIGQGAFNYCYDLTEITIPSSVTSISPGGYAFYNCTGLTHVTMNCNVPNSCFYTSSSSSPFYYCRNLSSVTLGEGITSIGNMAFYSATWLTEITLPSTVTSIGSQAFRSCTNLVSITIPSGVTSISEDMFYGCTGLTEVNLPNTITSIKSQAFYGCIGLTEITIPSSITTIQSYAFWNCTGLTHVTMNCNVLDNCFNKNSGSAAFYGCTSLSSVTLGEDITSIGNSAFSEADWLAEITIPSTVTSIGSSAFAGCTGLTEIIIPDSVALGAHVFSRCAGLTEITIPSGVTFGRDASNRYCQFSNCTSLTQVIINCDVVSRCFNIDQEISVFYHCTSLSSVTLGEGITTIGSYAFQNAMWLTEITLPSTITTIGEYAFYGCTGLTTITIPDSVTSIGSLAFSYCSSLESIIVDSNNTIYNDGNNSNCIIQTSNNYLNVGCKNTVIPNTVTSINAYAFAGCTELTTITIPDSVTYIGGNAFADCVGLTEINIPRQVSSISNGVFNDCSSLERITVHASNTTYNDGNNSNCIVYTRDHVLVAGCKNTTIPNTVTNIMTNAFQGCTGLTTITIPDSVTTIGSYAFYKCANLSSVTLGSGLITISQYAFSRCSSLTSIAIPQGVASIDYHVFDYCSSLSTITVDSNNTTYNDGNGSKCIIKTSNNQLIVGCNGTTIPNTVTSIGNYAFLGSGITSITIPNTITTFGMYAFAYCSELTHVTININVPGECFRANSSSSPFYQCTSLSSVTLGEGMTSIGYNAFQNCIWLTEITLPSTITTLASYVFDGCTSLTTITSKPTTPPSISSYSLPSTSIVQHIYVPAASVSDYQVASTWVNYYAVISAITE